VWSAQTDKLLHAVASLREGFALVRTQHPLKLRPVKPLAETQLPAIELAALFPESIARDEQATFACLSVVLQRIQHVAETTLYLPAKQRLLHFFTSFIKKL